MKVFKQMGDFMGVDKTSEQIRGHHIKMKKKFRTIDEIIRLLPKELKKKERKLQKLEKMVELRKRKKIDLEKVNVAEEWG